MSEALTERQRQILHVIEKSMQDRGYPPSVREIGEAVGLNSPSTVHNHLATLQKMGFLRRDPTKPRAIEVRFDTNSEVAMERRPSRHVPLIGDVAAGTNVLAQQNVEDLIPLPTDFTGEGDLFMLRVRGDSMIEAGILDGDFVVARQQQVADNGDIANWKIPGKMVKGMGGAMDLVASAENIIVAMQHTNPKGESKLLSACTLPITGVGCVKKVVTELAVLDIDPERGFVLLERAPGVSVEEIVAKTAGRLVVNGEIPEMKL